MKVGGLSGVYSDADGEMNGVMNVGDKCRRSFKGMFVE
jgi:hypothetical protein